MIWDSAPWKHELLRDLDKLEAWANKPRLTSRQEYIFERTIFVSAYAVRRLFEAGKVSDRVRDQWIGCHKSPRTSKTLTPISAHKVDELYDLSHRDKIEVQGKMLLNQIIHSQSFFLATRGNGKIIGFYVVSDRDKEKHILLVSLKKFDSWLRKIGNNFPSEVHTWLDEQTSKWKTVIR